jgi:hypothetical protein
VFALPSSAVLKPAQAGLVYIFTLSIVYKHFGNLKEFFFGFDSFISKF